MSNPAPGKKPASALKSPGRFKFPVSPSQVRDVFAALRSPDRPTRRMAWVFLLSLFCAGGVLVYSVKRAQVIRAYLTDRHQKQSKEAKQTEEFFRKQSEAAHQKAVVISAGVFTLELKTDPSKPKVPGISNLAELEIILQCDTKETQEFIEKNMARVRNEIIASFLPLEREQILSRNGKAALRHQILERLNSWLPHGKILELYFPKLLVT